MTIINVMLGTGPLIIPCAFTLGGWGLATIFIFAMGAISLFGGLFAVESLSIANALKSNVRTRL